MNKTIIVNLVCFLLLVSSNFSCSNSDVSNLSPKEKWSETLKGDGKILGAYPDLYVNYWEYTYNITDNQDVALRLTGAFPYSRYFSITIYNDETGTAVGSVDDYNIKPDAGSINPFVTSSTSDNYFTIYIVPSTMSDEKIASLNSKNVYKIPEGIKKLAICERQYLGTKKDGTKDEYGGVELPDITALNTNTLQKVELPEHIKSNLWKIFGKTFVLKSDKDNEVPFFLASQASYYPNFATDYLYARTELPQNSVLIFSFIPVPVPSKVEEYADAKARYWSICLGSASDTRSYKSLYDGNARYNNNEKCTFLICLANNPKIQQIRDKVNALNAKGGSYNLIEWDSEEITVDNKPVGNSFAIMYRQILPDKTWEHSISNMTPTNYYNGVLEPIEQVTDPNKQLAHKALGDYGMLGIKYSTEDFLNDNYSK